MRTFRARVNMPNLVHTLHQIFITHQKWFLASILLAAIILRLLFPENTLIGYDQVQILKNGHSILSGDATLIGPRTGPAQMFTGPLIYYLSVPLIATVGDVPTLIILPLLISTLTGLCLYLLTKRYIGDSEAVLLLTLWAFSPFLISIDQTVWNPSFTILASALIFLPLFSKKHDFKTFLLVGLGAFLTYQAHFSGFLLIGLALASVLLFRLKYQYLLAIAIGFMLSLLPTVLFDLRNNFLNLRGLIELLSRSSGLSLSGAVAQVIHNLQVILLLTGQLLFYQNAQSFVTVLGVLVLISGFFFLKNKEVKMSLVWVIATATCFAFYTGVKPEYYYLILIPPLLLILSKLLPKIGRIALTLLLILFILNSIWLTWVSQARIENLNLLVINQIRQQVMSNPPSEIVYDIPLGSDYGIRYFLEDLPLSSTGSKLHISYPNSLQFSGISRIGDVAYWNDPRTGSNNYLTKEKYIISTNPSVFAYKNEYPSQSVEIKPLDQYILVRDGVIVGTLKVTKSEFTDISWVKKCEQGLATQYLDWKAIGEDQYCLTQRDSTILIDSTLLPEEIDLSLL